MDPPLIGPKSSGSLCQTNSRERTSCILGTGFPLHFFILIYLLRAAKGKLKDSDRAGWRKLSQDLQPFQNFTIILAWSLSLLLFKYTVRLINFKKWCGHIQRVQIISAQYLHSWLVLGFKQSAMTTRESHLFDRLCKYITDCTETLYEGHGDSSICEVLWCMTFPLRFI